LAEVGVHAPHVRNTRGARHWKSSGNLPPVKTIDGKKVYAWRGLLRVYNEDTRNCEEAMTDMSFSEEKLEWCERARVNFLTRHYGKMYFLNGSPEMRLSRRFVEKWPTGKMVHTQSKLTDCTLYFGPAPHQHSSPIHLPRSPFHFLAASSALQRAKARSAYTSENVRRWERLGAKIHVHWMTNILGEDMRTQHLARKQFATSALIALDVRNITFS